ncbi:MAG: hypothetical protein MUC58_02560 [Rhizobiaceae bacterium]|nr:hypothetical protein [Rhizobiaceae bacterium]
MLRLAAVIYILAAPVIMGSLVTAFLTVDQLGAEYLGLAGVAAIGAVLAAPVAWLVARAILKQTRKPA